MCWGTHLPSARKASKAQGAGSGWVLPSASWARTIHPSLIILCAPHRRVQVHKCPQGDRSTHQAPLRHGVLSLDKCIADIHARCPPTASPRGQWTPWERLPRGREDPAACGQGNVAALLSTNSHTRSRLLMASSSLSFPIRTQRGAPTWPSPCQS